ncbi:MAG: thiamine/thiamine pyrophosphate ABC transporter permease [Rhizobiaceae bacterium]
MYRSLTPALLALASLAILVGGAFIGLGVEAVRDVEGAFASFDAYLLRMARFTLWQALLSTALSVVPAIFVARAFDRHPHFPGRTLMLRLFALPLSLPAIVVALGILSLLGRAGYLAGALSLLYGETWPGIYGLSGILVAHVFFNLPLATRLFLQALETVPSDQLRLASQLGMGAGPVFRLIEWPALRSALPGVAGLIFMLCVTSFTIVLTLGGGPRASTLEVGIYQALRFDFDPARAVALTLVQIALTMAIVLTLSRIGVSMTGEAALSVSRRRHLSQTSFEIAANAAVIILAAIFVLGPLAAIAAAGLQADLIRLVTSEAVARAAMTSIVLASLSALLAIALSWSLAAGRRRLAVARRNTWLSLLERLMDSGAGLVLVIPPIVIGSGWFMLLRQSVDVLALAPVMVVAVNAAMAMPFAMRAIRPAYDAAADRHDRIAAQLGIQGWNRLRLIDWPGMRRPVFTALMFAMALSLGDLGVIALFGSDAVQTLPYLLLASMGSYRTADAAGIALLLAILCLGLTIAADRFGKEPPHG